MMITRSTKLKLNYSNQHKKETLFWCFNKHVEALCLELINNLIYQEGKIPSLLPKKYTDRLPFSARVNQLLAKECSSVARSARAKIEKISTREGANIEKYQKEILEKFRAKTLQIKKIGQFNLDSRFISIERNINSKKFEYWISCKYPGMDKVYIPFRETRHMRKLVERGYSLKNSTVRIKRNGEIELVFTKEDVVSNGRSNVGIDTGRNKAFITSDDIKDERSKDVLNNLKRKKHGSKNKSSQVRRLKQIYDLEIKKIDFKSTKSIFLENLNGMKIGKKWGNINHHWSYRYIQNRISLHAEEHGVHVHFVSPSYTSQICSSCGFKHKDNRKSEKFLCLSCEMEMDADLNAAKNILQRGTNSAHYQKSW
jgi:putative transposase